MRSVYGLLSLLRVGCVLSASLWTPLAFGAPAEGGAGVVDAAAHRTPTHVACVGDSITAGFGAQTKGYVSDLIDMFGPKVKVGGFGHSGACMISNCNPPTEPYQGLQEYKDATTFVADAGASSVVDVIIMLGTNDAAPQNWPAGGNVAQLTKDYGDMLDHFMSLGTHPVVYMVLPPAAFDPTRATNLQTGVIPAIQQLAQARRMPLIDVNTPTLNHPEWSADGLHPNDAGHLVIAQTMYAAMLDLPIPTPEPEHDAGGSGGASGSDGGGTSSHAGSGGTSTIGSSGGAPGGSGSGDTKVGHASSNGGAGAGDPTAVSDSESEASQSGGCNVAKTPSTQGASGFGWLLAALGYGATRRRWIITKG